MILSEAELKSITHVASNQPHAILGMHLCKFGSKDGLVVRAYLDNAKSCRVVDVSKSEGSHYPLERLTEDGFFEGFISRKRAFNYRLQVEQYNGEIRQFYDPYCFLPSMSEEDVYLFNEGNHHQAYKVMGAHLRELEGVAGVSFTVWAPNALSLIHI